MTAAMTTAVAAATMTATAAAMTSSMTSSCTGCGNDVVGGLGASSRTTAASTAAQQGQEGAIADAQRGQQTNEDLHKESGASASVIIQKEQLPLSISFCLCLFLPLVLTFIAY